MPFKKGNIPWIKGRKLTDEHKKKISEAEKGYKPWRYKVAGWNRGVARTEEQKKAHSEKMKGRKASESTKNKQSVSHKIFWETYDSTQRNEKISKANKGKNFSKEHRKKLSISHKGEKSYTWKGGITPINQLIRTSMEYRHWRISVKKRDNYTCIWCGSKKQLHVDHIKPFAYYPELRFEIDNGRTLCVPCHKTTDTYARRIKNI